MLNDKNIQTLFIYKKRKRKTNIVFGHFNVDPKQAEMTGKKNKKTKKLLTGRNLEQDRVGAKDIKKRRAGGDNGRGFSYSRLPETLSKFHHTRRTRSNFFHRKPLLSYKNVLTKMKYSFSYI